MRVFAACDASFVPNSRLHFPNFCVLLYCFRRRLLTILISYRLPWRDCRRREPLFTRDHVSYCVKHAHSKT